MGALLSSPGLPEHAELSGKTGFSVKQIAVLHKRFKLLSHNKDTLRREDFDSIPDLAFNPIRNEIIAAFFDRRNYRQSAEGKVEEISFEEFLLVISHFRPPLHSLTEEERETIRKEKLQFLFNMHDTDNDGTITTEEYRHMVKDLLSRSGKMGEDKTELIADAAKQEVASTLQAHMDSDETYEGITFDHFYRLLSDFDIEHKMCLRF